MATTIAINTDTNNVAQYSKAVEAIKTAILKGQLEAAAGVNRVQLALYYAIGKFLSRHTRKGVWGENALATISEQLQKELPGLRGFSENSLKNMRKFYEAWNILDAKEAPKRNEKETTTTIVDSQNSNSTIAIVETEKTPETIDIQNPIVIQNTLDFPLEDFFRVPFTHHIRILEGIEDIKSRNYYIHRTAEEHLPVRKLQQLIKEKAHVLQNSMPSNFSHTIDSPTEVRRAVEMFKDEYLLDFINVEEIGQRDKIDVDERIVEQKITQNIKNFIMTFGRDFAFIGNQYHLEIYGVDHFPDLLFFNRELNAMVVVELKLGNFKTSYLGQLFGYLQILDDHVRKPHENPSIGIVLCQSANHSYAEYAVRDYTKPMGVATYKTLDDMPEDFRKALPDVQRMIDIINDK